VTIFSRRLDNLVGVLESADGLDAVAERLAGVSGRLLPTGPIKDAASGTTLGHPLHPALVAMPMGCWLAATFLDYTGGSDAHRGHGGRAGRRPAQRLVGLGVLTAVPTAIAGVSDWLDTAEGERRVGLIHAAANATALTGYAASWLLRRAGRHRAGITVSTVSGAFLVAAGWLGAHLVYAAGVGVDTTAFQKFPTKWTDTGLQCDDLPSDSAVGLTVEGVPLLVSRSGRSVHVIANRCTHRGAPLDEGIIADGCVTCPWHGSQFDLIDGAVRRGPATRPQPALEARVTKRRVQVRRPDEVRALRLNPDGV
jgi:nitrite reductase/ring-hydroxylating ferredoxin subunit/uncharacterized membrane protein